MESVSTLIIALIGVCLSLYNFYDLSRQRKIELRWKKAEKAKEIIDEIYDNEYSYKAILLCSGNDVKIELKVINHETFINCIKDPHRNISNTDNLIFECIDELIYYLHSLENWIAIGLIEFNDLKPTFEWTVSKLGNNKVDLVNYANEFGYKKCGSFLARFGN